MRGDDGQEHRPGQRGQVGAEQVPRVEVHAVPVVGGVTVDLHREPDGLVAGQLVEQRRDVARDAGAHQHDVDAGEHRAVRRRRRGHLHLLQVVDPDRPVVALLGQPDLDEVAQDRELLGLPVLPQREPGARGVGRAGRPSAVAEVPGERAVGDRRHRERGHRPTGRAVGVAVLQPPGEHGVQRGAGDHAELPGAGDRRREPPGRHGHAHAALDHQRPQRGGCAAPVGQRTGGGGGRGGRSDRSDRGERGGGGRAGCGAGGSRHGLHLSKVAAAKVTQP